MGCFSNLVTGFAKYILFLFNLLILVAAAILIGMAVKYNINNHGLDLGTASIFPIVLGVLIALVAFFGCCGAVRESSCMLTTYATVLIVLFIIQLVLGILALIAIKKNENNKVEIVHDYLKKLYEKYESDSDSHKVIDDLQKSLECCGLDGRSEAYVQNKTNPGTLINSCCKDTVPCTVQKAYENNCSDELADNLGSILKAIGIVAIVFGAIELLAAIFACCVKNSS